MTEKEQGSKRTRGKIAREVRQRLETNRLFGWNVPLSVSRIRPVRRSKAGAGTGTGTGTGTGAVVDRVGREALLRPIREEVATCVRCALGHTRTQAVFGVGDPGARLLFIGEAPGFDEDRQGEPFVGRAGQLLNDIIKAMGLRREEVYIANVIKCRPPGNRNPEPDEVASCEPFLKRQLAAIRPRMIVALGKFAAQCLLRDDTPITRMRGGFRSYEGIPLMPTLHPAYLLRDPSKKKLAWEDLKAVNAALAKVGIHPPRPPAA